MRAMLVWFGEGGPIMFVLALIGAAGLAVLIERLYVIVVRSKNNGRVFIERIIQLVRGGKSEEAIKLCARSSATLPDIGLLLLRSRSRDTSDLQHVAAAALLLVVPRLARRLPYLRSLAVVALLVGLLGTVQGIHDTLRGASTAREGQLWSGLAASLAPLAFSLGIGAVLTLGRAYLVSQSEAIAEESREFSARLINALIDRPDVRLGHRS